MTDLSALSNEQLQALYSQPKAAPDVSSMSDADLMKAYGAPPVGRGEDAAKSVGVGLENAAISTVGGVGDIRDLASKGIDAAAGKLGFDPSNFKSGLSKAAQFNPVTSAIANAPTSDQIKSTFSDPVVPYDYKPQYVTGDLAKKTAEFAPNMLTGGPRGMIPRLLTNVVAPAIGSEVGESVGGPLGSVAGALIGGAGAGKIANSMAESRAIKAVTPALADVKAEATNAYDALSNRHIATPIPQSALDVLAMDITTSLNAKGIRPSTAQSIHNAVEEIKTPATAGAADVADLVAARQNIKGLLSAPDANKAGAFVALQKVEKAIEQNSPGTMKTIREADKNYSAAKAVESLDKRTAKAELRAASTDSGMNVGNKIRQNVATYLGSSEAKYLSAETKADLEKIVRGTASQNLMRHAANLLGGGGGLGMLAGGTAGYEAGGWPGALAGAATGRAFKMANNRSVLKQAERVSQNIRLRSPLGQQSPLLLPQMTNPLLSGALPAFLARPQ